jgi:ribosomal protein S18 acetylase RimI-like enzyme
MTDSEILLARPADVNQLVDLVNKSYRGESSKLGWTNEAALLEGARTDENSMLTMLNDPYITILKYQLDGQLIGCVQLEKKETRLYVSMLAVSPEHQARGIGKRLLHAAEDFAKVLGCSLLTMTVIAERYELIDFYKRQGYTETGRILPFPDDANVGTPIRELNFTEMIKR